MHYREPVYLPYLGALWITGDDTAEFLDRQLTAPASNLDVGAGRLACWCDPKGRVIAPLWLVRTADQAYCAILSAALVGTARQRLGLYVLRDDVCVQCLPDAECVAGVESPDRGPGQNWPGLLWRPGAKLTVVDAAATRADGAGAWRLADIEHGLAWLDEQTTGRFLPQALGMDHWGGVDYHKGCYPGQEVISRTHYLGRLKRNLWLVELDDAQPPAPGTDVVNPQGRSCGQMLDSECSQRGAAGLAVLHDSCVQEVLSLSGNAGALQVRLRHRVGSEMTSE